MPARHACGMNAMLLSPARMYAHLLRHDLSAFIHRSFLELNPQTQFHSNWHIEVVASKLEDVRSGRCRRLIVNVPPRHLKSHAISVVFPAWLLGHEPSKQILSVTYAQDLSETLARGSRSLMGSVFIKRFLIPVCLGSDFRLRDDRRRLPIFNLGRGCVNGSRGRRHHY